MKGSLLPMNSVIRCHDINYILIHLLGRRKIILLHPAFPGIARYIGIKSHRSTYSVVARSAFGFEAFIQPNAEAPPIGFEGRRAPVTGHASL